MEMCSVYLFVIPLCFSSILAREHNFKANKIKVEKRLSYVDTLIENLQSEHWEDDAICYNKIFEILLNARNSTVWAVWVLDSIQLPTGVLYGSKYQLGNYDECMKAPWLDTHPELRTKHCLADVHLTGVVPQKGGKFDPDGTTVPYINTKTKHARALNTITWGVCVPSQCRKEGVATFLRMLLRVSVLGGLSSEPRIAVDDCQLAGEPYLYPRGVFVFFYLILFLLVVAVASTWYLSVNDCKTSDSILPKLAKVFCMNKNAYDLVKPSSDDIPALHGMRALTAIIFVLTHQVFFHNSGAVVNGLDVDKDLDMILFTIHTDLLTDTFLLMSGLLLARGLATKEKLENPLVALWKRYIRLIGPMALMVFYMTSVFKHMGDGPMWGRLVGYEQKTCEKNWWLSLLMLNNYINSEEMKWSTILFTLAFTLAWVPMSLGGVFYTREYDVLEAVVYASTNRIIWALAISAVIIICEYGYIPIVSNLLGWSAWVPLSRLSYGLYLTHPALIMYSVYSARAPLTQQPFTLLSHSFGPLVIGCLLSLIIWLLVHAPIIGLTNLKLRSKKQAPQTALSDESSQKKNVEKIEINNVNNKAKML